MSDLGFGTDYDFGIADMIAGGGNSGSGVGGDFDGDGDFDEDDLDDAESEEMLVMIVSAGDDSVCEECWEWDGEIVSLEEALDILPIHPNCRCTIINPETGKELEGAGDMLDFSSLWGFISSFLVAATKMSIDAFVKTVMGEDWTGDRRRRR